MLSGLGDIYIKTTGLAGGATAQKMIPLFLFQFEFSQEAESKEAQGFVGGRLVTKSTAEASVSSTVKLTTQFTDWQQLGLVLDQFPRVLTNEKLVVLKTATVPSVAPYEIVDAAITVANTNDIFANIAGAGVWGQPKPLPRAATPATPATGQVGVDTTGTKLVFNVAQAGAPVTYTVPVTLTSVEAYGGSGTLSKIGNLEFNGIIYSPEASQGIPISFPLLQRKTRPTMTISNDVPEFEIEFGAIPPVGWDEPYKILNRNTAP
ncbi:hypothetical protein AB3R30_19840 [Leptolyngbyaceae cyanobacterium UHCC 1019]